MFESLIKVEWKEYKQNCIYFLFKNKKVIYVGKTPGNLLARINEHNKNKDFDEVFYKEVNTANNCELRKIEKAIVKLLRPKYNKENYLNSEFNIQDELCLKKYGITIKEFIK